MAVKARIKIGDAIAEIEFLPNSQNIVTDIVIRNTLPVTVHAKINASSGYSFDSELVLTEPLTVNIPKPRQFPDDNTADVSLSSTVRSV